MPEFIIYFSGAIVLIAVLFFLLIVFIFRNDKNFLIAMLSFDVIVFVATSTFGKSLVINFAARVQELTLSGVYGNPASHVWESVVIIGIMAFTALFVMFYRYRIEINPTKQTNV